MINTIRHIALSGLIFASLGAAYYIEYVEQVIPCKLCYITRYIYFLIGFLSLIAIFIPRKIKNLFTIIIYFSLAGLILISGYQVLVGSNLVNYECLQPDHLKQIYAVTDTPHNKLKKMTAAIMKNQAVPCNIEYKQFGIPLTWFNLFFSVLLAIIYFVFPNKIMSSRFILNKN